MSRRNVVDRHSLGIERLTALPTGSSNWLRLTAELTQLRHVNRSLTSAARQGQAAGFFVSLEQRLQDGGQLIDGTFGNGADAGAGQDALAPPPAQAMVHSHVVHGHGVEPGLYMSERERHGDNGAPHDGQRATNDPDHYHHSDHHAPTPPHHHDDDHHHHRDAHHHAQGEDHAPGRDPRSAAEIRILELEREKEALLKIVASTSARPERRKRDKQRGARGARGTRPGASRAASKLVGDFGDAQERHLVDCVQEELRGMGDDDEGLEVVGVLVETLRLENKRLRKHSRGLEGERSKLKSAVKKLSKDNEYLREAFVATRDRSERLLELTRTLVGRDAQDFSTLGSLPRGVEAELLNAEAEARAQHRPPCQPCACTDEDDDAGGERASAHAHPAYNHTRAHTRAHDYDYDHDHDHDHASAWAGRVTHRGRDNEARSRYKSRQELLQENTVLRCQLDMGRR